MKSVLSLILTLVMCLMLGACGEADGGPKASDSATVNTPVAEMQTEPRQDSAQEEKPQLATEDFEIVRYDKDSFSFKVKFRNISDRDLDSIVFVYQLLDANGDILSDHLCGAMSVGAGQAIWTGTFSPESDINIQDIAAVSFVSAPQYIPERNPIAEKITFQIPSGRAAGDDVQLADNTEAVEQFRQYLQERGAVTVVTEKIDNKNSVGQHQVTVEAIENGIQVLYEDEVTTLVNKASAFGKSLLRFTLTANVRNVNADVEYFLSSSDGHGHSDTRSISTTYLLNIHDYRSGDAVSLTADYTHVDENGNSIKEEGTQLELVLTNPCADAVEVLSQILQESGMDLTMADLGFANY